MFIFCSAIYVKLFMCQDSWFVKDWRIYNKIELHEKDVINLFIREILRENVDRKCKYNFLVYFIAMFWDAVLQAVFETRTANVNIFELNRSCYFCLVLQKYFWIICMCCPEGGSRSTKSEQQHLARLLKVSFVPKPDRVLVKSRKKSGDKKSCSVSRQTLRGRKI